MCLTSAANSAGLPRRDGNGTILPSESWTSCGMREQHRGFEDAGRDGQAADAAPCQFAGHRQGHGDDAALRCGIGRLPQLPFEGGHARRIDDHAALAAGIRLALHHRLGGETDHVEGADQVDVDRPHEAFQPVRPFAPDHLLGRADAGAIDQPVQAAEGGNCRIDGVDRARLTGNVGFDEARIGAKFGRQSLARLTVHIRQHHFRAAIDQVARRRRPKAGTRTRHQKNLVLDFHSLSPQSVIIAPAPRQTAAYGTARNINLKRKSSETLDFLPATVKFSSITY